MIDNAKIVKSIAQIRKGKNVTENYTYILNEVAPLINSLGCRICKTIKVEDRNSAAKLAIINCIKTYDPRKAKFITHAFIHIRQALSDLWRETGCIDKSLHYRKTSGNIEQIDINDALNEKEHSYTVDMEYDKYYMLPMALQAINMKFPQAYINCFVDYYVEGLPLHKISKKYKLNAGFVINLLISHIRKKLKIQEEGK